MVPLTLLFNVIQLHSFTSSFVCHSLCNDFVNCRWVVILYATVFVSVVVMCYILTHLWWKTAAINAFSFCTVHWSLCV